MASGWQRLLIVTGGKNPTPKAIPANLELILSHHKGWKDVLGFDELAGAVVFLKEPPWHDESRIDSQKDAAWTDEDTTRLRNWCGRTFNFSPTASDVSDVVTQVAHRRRFHPIRDRLESFVWDKTPRLDTWLHRVCGAADNEYVKAVASKWLIAAVARVYQPGCKVDSMPLFEGDQGTGKSSMVRILALEEAWFLETNIDLGGKDSLQILRRKWIVEFSEIDSLSRVEVSRAKAFISTRFDTYRPSFGRRSQDFPRQCVFAGTLNPDGGYLKDNTGARRFWPVKLEYINLRRLKKEVEQLWAEAVHRYKAKETWHFESRALVKTAAKEADERRVEHPWEGKVARWLDRHGADYAEKGITTHDVLIKCLDKRTADLSRTEEMVMAGLLRRCGWNDVYRDCSTPDRPRRYRNPKLIAELEEAEEALLAAAGLGGRERSVQDPSEKDLPSIISQPPNLFSKDIKKKKAE